MDTFKVARMQNEKLKLVMDFHTHKDLDPVDLHREIKRKNLNLESAKNVRNEDPNFWTGKVTANTQEQLIVNDTKLFGGGETKSSLVDWTSWLPFAAKEYNISPDVRDYVVVPIPTIVTDLPNRNGIGFPLKELVKFRPHLGMQSYQSWKGKPTFEEHANSDHTVAKGVILDTHMRKIPGMNVWRLMKLLAFDRTRDPKLVQEILDKKRNSYSMGAYLDGYTCSYCHAQQGKGLGCNHVPYNMSSEDVAFIPNRQLNTLIFRNVINPEGFETSSVKTPAYISALYDGVIDMRELLGEPPSKDSELEIIQLANASRANFGRGGVHGKD